MNDPQTRIYFLTPADLLILRNDRNHVAVILKYPHDVTGLAPGVELGIELAPDEARALAEQLVQMAASVEAGPFRRS